MTPDAAMVVEHLVQVERAVQTRDPMDLLVKCNDLAAVDWRDGYALSVSWAGIMGRSPSSVECACRNAIAWVLDGRPPEGDRWSGGERRPDDEVRRDFRARKTMLRLAISPHDAPEFVVLPDLVETLPDGKNRHHPAVKLGDRGPWVEAPMETFDEEAERWRVEMAVKVERQRAARAARHAEDDRAADKERRFTQGAIDKALDRIATAIEGSRNHTLNKAAYSLGGLVGSGLLDEADVVEVLVAAAVAVGVREREARRVVAAGMSRGKMNPRGMEQ